MVKPEARSLGYADKFPTARKTGNPPEAPRPVGCTNTGGYWSCLSPMFRFFIPPCSWFPSSPPLRADLVPSPTQSTGPLPDGEAQTPKISTKDVGIAKISRCQGICRSCCQQPTIDMLDCRG